MKKRHGTSGRKFLLATALSGATGLWSGGALGEEADAGPDSEVVVTGQRSAGAVEEKRAALGVVDSLDAAQMQALPDNTVAEVLARLPGLSVTANNDNEQGRNVAQHPAIRGLDSKYNNISFDGLPIATADYVGTGVSSRATPLDILPVTLVEGIDVYKTYSPDRDPQAIGGGIVLRTHSAFDQGGAPVTQLVAGGGFNSLNSQPYRQDPVNLNADLLFSRVFGSERQFGFVLSADYQRQADYTTDNATTDSVFYNFYNSAGTLVSKPSLSNGFAVPQQDKSWVIEEVTKKIDITAKFEYRPTDQLAAFATAGIYDETNDSTRNEIILTPGGQLTNQTATSGTYSQGDVELGGQYSPLHRTTYNYQTGVTYRPDMLDVVDLRAGWSRATRFQPQYMVKYINSTVNSPTGNSAVKTSTANGFNYNLYGNYSNFLMDPATFENAANYGGYYWRFRRRNIMNDVATIKLDYGHNADPDSQGLGFKIGAELEHTRAALNYRTPDYEPNATGQVTLANTGAQGLSSFTIPNNSLPFMLIDVQQAFRYLNANIGQFHSTNQNVNNTVNNFKLRESVADAYAMLVYNAEDFHAMAGVRRDGSGDDVTGAQQQPNPTGVASSGLAGTAYPAFKPIRTTSNYGNFLPAASIDYLPVQDLQLRAAISKTVGRPDYSDYSPSSGVSQDPNTGIVTITQGNPNLKPRLATNYDVAIDWYFAPNSLLSVAPFYKTIDNEIFSISTNAAVLYNNVVTPAVETEPANAASSHIEGAEFELAHRNYGDLTPWLEGVGTDLNYSMMYGRATIPSTSVSGTSVVASSRVLKGLINQPNQIANAVLTYDSSGVFGALSYNYTGTSLRSLVANAAWQDVYWAPHRQVDLRVGYHLAPGFDIAATLQNLNDETVKSVTGPDKNLLKDNYFVGQTYWLKLVYRFGA